MSSVLRKLPLKLGLAFLVPLLLASYVFAAGYYAVCGEQHGITLGWTGPTRSTYAAAEKDAAAHKTRYGHDAQVLQQ